jgi:hypothetical protein
VTYLRIAPGFRIPFGHRHKQQEEVYVLVNGSARIRIDGEVRDMKQWDAVRLHRDAVRALEGGDEGAELIAIGAPNTGPGDADMTRIGGATSAPADRASSPTRPRSRTASSAVGGCRAARSRREFGTPLVVYCRDTVLARARAYARVDPDALVVYGTKAFPNVAAAAAARRRRAGSGRVDAG